MDIAATPEWAALTEHHSAVAGLHDVDLQVDLVALDGAADWVDLANLSVRSAVPLRAGCPEL